MEMFVFSETRNKKRLGWGWGGGCTVVLLSRRSSDAVGSSQPGSLLYNQPRETDLKKGKELKLRRWLVLGPHTHLHTHSYDVVSTDKNNKEHPLRLLLYTLVQKLWFLLLYHVLRACFTKSHHQGVLRMLWLRPSSATLVNKLISPLKLIILARRRTDVRDGTRVCFHSNLAIGP